MPRIPPAALARENLDEKKRREASEVNDLSALCAAAMKFFVFPPPPLVCSGFSRQRSPKGGRAPSRRLRQ